MGPFAAACQKGWKVRAVASHIVEDVMNPEILLQMLPPIAQRGFVSMPSKFTELKRGGEGFGPHRGHIHHRWIGTIQAGRLLLLPKLSFLETVESWKLLEML